MDPIVGIYVCIYMLNVEEGNVFALMCFASTLDKSVIMNWNLQSLKSLNSGLVEWF